MSLSEERDLQHPQTHKPNDNASVEHVENAEASRQESASSSSTTDCDDNSTVHYTEYPNRWSRIREVIREPVAEFFGTMVLVIFGNGAACQVTLSSDPAVASSPKGDFLSSSLGWATGAALGVWISGGISGGHINPAVTIALATFRDFPWRKVPVFVFAQLLGALCGAGIIYGNYIHAIDIYEGGRNVRTVPGTASLFATYALNYVTSVSCFFEEVIGTTFFLLAVCAITDKNNGPPPPGLVPLVFFIAVLGIGIALGSQTGYAINPARDLGPRLLTAMVGYGKEVFTFRNQYWLWCPIIGPIVGALLGTFIYDAFFFTGAESLLNRPDSRARARHERAKDAERQKLVAGTESV